MSFEERTKCDVTDALFARIRVIEREPGMGGGWWGLLPTAREHPNGFDCVTALTLRYSQFIGSEHHTELHDDRTTV